MSIVIVLFYTKIMRLDYWCALSCYYGAGAFLGVQRVYCLFTVASVVQRYMHSLMLNSVAQLCRILFTGFYAQVISDACSEKKSELRSLERNVTALSSATQALHGWIKVNEAKVAALPENVSPSNVIVPVDDLSEGAIAAQVHTHDVLFFTSPYCQAACT